MRKNILILGHNDATQFIDIFNQYTRLFDRHFYKVTVAYLTGSPSEETRKRTIAEEVLFLEAPKNDIRGLKLATIKQLLSLCHERNFEIVVCHRYKPSYVMMWVAQFCKIPALIMVMHELGTMRSIKRQLLIACLKRKNMLFAGVSDAVRDDMRKSLWCIPNERIITLYNVIDVNDTLPLYVSREESRQFLNLPTDAFIFGTIGRLTANKDQKSLITAFALLKQQYHNAKLIIMGDGELEQTLKTQVQQLDLSDAVVFTGFVPLGMRYMKAFDCFILPSTQEAFGRVLLEAMLAKLPVIATKVNGIPEVMGHAGILVDARDIAGINAAMTKIYCTSTAERDLLGENAYQHTVDNFSIPKFCEQFWQTPLLQQLKVNT